MNRLALALLAALAPALAGATTCRIVVGSLLAFGEYEWQSTAPTDSLTAILVECERDGGEARVSVTARVDAGAHADAGGARRMLHTGGSGDLLAYSLSWLQPSRGGSSDAVDSVTANLWVPNKGYAGASFILFGRIAARQDVRAGWYADRVQLRILY